MLDITKKQYIISSIKLKIPNMVAMPMRNGVVLYCGSDLKVFEMKDVFGRHYILLGEAYCTDLYPKSPDEDICNFTGESLFELTQSWTGRWVLIRDNELIIDASGMMSAFYFTTTSNQWLVSSSLALLSFVAEVNSKESVSESGINWRILPDSLIDGVSQLLCTQKILFNKTLETEFYSRFVDYRELTTEDKVDLITNRLNICLKNIQKFSNRQIVIALTAGKDSRLVLASALFSKVHFSTYTMEHPKMLYADRTLPKKIAKDYDFNWMFTKQKKYNTRKAQEYLLFCGGNSKGADVFFYATDQFEQLPKNAIIIRSGLFESGQLYGRKTAGETRESFKEGFEKYYSSSFKNQKQYHSFYKWLQYENSNPIPFMDIRDRFYIEQRVNGWAAAIEQALDINDFVSVQIANCQEILSILLSANIQEREGLKLAYDMISKLDPHLLEYPVNRIYILDRIRFYRRAILKKIFR